MDMALPVVNATAAVLARVSAAFNGPLPAQSSLGSILMVVPLSSCVHKMGRATNHQRSHSLKSAAGPHTIVDGKEVVNFASANYLGLFGNEKIIDSCISSLEKYGVGSCGPRGFYGTIDVHLDCESKIAKFLGTPDSILYSYGISTIFSVIPAFCKKGDIIVADEDVHWAVQNGLHLSRSTMVYFKHNDMASLASTLEKLTRGNKRAEKIRRYIVVESIYQNSGQIAPLDEIVRLKEKYRFRVILEESHSFGVLGKSGRGLDEHYGVPVSVWPQLFLMFHRNAPPVVSDRGALLPSSQTRPNYLVKCLGQSGQQEWSHGTLAGGVRQRQPMYPLDNLVLT
ncbi:Long chain base biosynthesis protein 1a [Zea mays]|uniref:serine C-palmitoyltransferase n=1 Tax=Zea mays TaxID=4577 RepID=A0A3L6FQP2_MAIZE|nr:Long chain base biosynthesis protein 1a [Zea mays]